MANKETKKPATTKSTKSTLLQRVIVECNKTDKEIQKEELGDRIDTFKLDCDENIQLYKAQLPTLNNNITKAKRELAKAKSNLEKGKLTSVISRSSFEGYCSELGSLKELILNADSNVKYREEQKRNVEAQISELEEIATYLA